MNMRQVGTQKFHVIYESKKKQIGLRLKCKQQQAMLLIRKSRYLEVKIPLKEVVKIIPNDEAEKKFWISGFEPDTFTERLSNLINCCQPEDEIPLKMIKFSILDN